MKNFNWFEKFKPKIQFEAQCMFFLRDKKISLSIFGVVISKYELVGHFYKFFKYHPGTYKVHRIQQKQIYHHLLPGERNKR